MTHECDILVIGSGFAGCVTALILRRLGFKVMVVDRATHPRFAIGESSTPIANMVLRDLAQRYDLPALTPLTKFGTWQATYPHLGCGLKRGFSYFKHETGESFSPRPDHSNELLVTASRTDAHGDTHWLRADVDQFLATQVVGAGIQLLEATAIDAVEQHEGGWQVSSRGPAGESSIRATFIIDASGTAGVMPQALGIADGASDLLTRSRAIYAHFRGVEDWQGVLRAAGGAVDDHPFCCDDAAQHHILDGAWMWMLRFNNAVTSVGLVLDERRYPFDPALSVEDEWRHWLTRYPSLGQLLSRADVCDPPEGLIRTARLQRRWSRIVGSHWAALPHTAGFIDPLHSTGIAHSLCGVELLVEILADHWQRETLPVELQGYEARVFTELGTIDELVAGCFSAFDDFSLLVSYSMVYFAAATTYERRRAESGESATFFLCADNAELCAVVSRLRQQLTEGALDDGGFADEVATALAPFNHVGLCNPSCHNMYRYTAAPQ